MRELALRGKELGKPGRVKENTVLRGCGETPLLLSCLLSCLGACVPVCVFFLLGHQDFCGNFLVEPGRVHGLVNWVVFKRIRLWVVVESEVEIESSLSSPKRVQVECGGIGEFVRGTIGRKSGLIYHAED